MTKTDDGNDSTTKRTVTLAVAFPHDSFDPNRRGYPVITAAGVDVDADQAKKIIDSAAVAGVTVREV